MFVLGNPSGVESYEGCGSSGNSGLGTQSVTQGRFCIAAMRTLCGIIINQETTDIMGEHW